MAMCLNTPAVCSAPSAFSMRNHSSLFFHWLKFPRKISGNRLQRGPQQSKGRQYAHYRRRLSELLSDYNNGYCVHQRIQTPSITAPAVLIKCCLHFRCCQRRDGSNALFSISNSSEVIPGGIQTRLFERFFRVSESRDRQSGGAGLGLSLCREIALAHGRATETSIIGCQRHDVPPHHPDPGAGSVFAWFCRRENWKKVWRFLQRIVSNGLALKTAILRGDELKEFPHACKPETKKTIAWTSLLSPTSSASISRGALQLRAFVFRKRDPTRMTFFDDSVTEENALIRTTLAGKFLGMSRMLSHSSVPSEVMPYSEVLRKAGSWFFFRLACFLLLMVIVHRGPRMGKGAALAGGVFCRSMEFSRADSRIRTGRGFFNPSSGAWEAVASRMEPEARKQMENGHPNLRCWNCGHHNLPCLADVGVHGNFFAPRGRDPEHRELYVARIHSLRKHLQARPKSRFL